MSRGSIGAFHRDGSGGAGRRALRRQLVLGGAVVAASGAVIGFFLAAGIVLDESFGSFSRDAVDTLDAPRYIGSLALLMVLVWTAGTTSSFLAAMVLHSSGRHAHGRFHLAVGALSATLVLDDAFLLHEALYPKIGVPEHVVFGAYAVLVALFAWAFRAQIRASGSAVLALAALACFGLSVAADQAFSGRHLLEDGPKLVAVSLWAAFCVRTSWRALLDVSSPLRQG